MSRGFQQIGKYRIERRLGSGSFATVWLGYDPDLDVQVAIKVLANNWAADEDVKRRFLQEARMLFRLNDPRVIRVYTTGEHDDGCPYFVMDYADRGNLEERITARQGANRPFAVAEALMIGREMADCVGVIHRVGIVHRDLKPSNVLYRSDPDAPHGERMLLGDFGIARSIEGGARSTIVAGSPFYMAPEQAEESTARDVDGRADVYACTVILYELLAGRVPYPFATISEIRRAQEAGRLTPLGELRAGVPADVSALVERGLRLDPDERFPTIAAWAGAVDAALTRLSTLPSMAAGEETLVTDAGQATLVPPLDAPPARPKAESRADEQERQAAPDAPPPPREPRRGRADPDAETARRAASAAAARPAPPPRGQAKGTGSTSPRVISEDEARARLAARSASAVPATLDAPVQPAARPKRRRGLKAFAVIALLAGGGLAYNEYRDGGLPFIVPTATVGSVATPTPFSFDTPTSAANAGFTPVPFNTPTPGAAVFTVADEDFEDPSRSVIRPFTTDTQAGAVLDGVYAFTPPAATASWVTEGVTPFAEGYAIVYVTIAGDGSAGIVARDRYALDGSETLDTCWVTAAGAAGCAYLTPTGWQNYFFFPNGSVVLYGDDELTLAIADGMLSFWVNDLLIGQAPVIDADPGYWGILAGNYTGASTTYFDDLYIASRT